MQCLLDSALEPVVAERIAEARELAQLKHKNDIDKLETMKAFARALDNNTELAKGTWKQVESGNSERIANSVPFEKSVERIPTLQRQQLLAESSILNLKVCDPASGSGHFLIAAAHRLTRHLARIRTGEAEPTPDEYQSALRDIIGRCIYGVDINPMAVELCKVSLWMEAIDPGKPLSFLDHHIQCGNSLLGSTPRLLAQGIPNEAFAAIEGDDKKVVKSLKADNKRERDDRASGQLSFFETFFPLGNLPSVFANLNIANDDTVDDVLATEKRYSEAVSGAEYANARLLADTWCAAFVWKKDDSELGKLCPTERNFRKVESHAATGLLPHVRAEVERLRDQYQFFHWHLAFPDVFRLPGKDEQPENEPTGWSGGFDVVLGNPPWEHVELKEKEWFAERCPEIANARTGAERKRMIERLAQRDPALYFQFVDAKRGREGRSLFLGNSDRFPLCGRGRINLYAVFAENMRTLISRTGSAGSVLPTGIATDDTTKHFFQSLVQRMSLVRLSSFENEEFLFPGVDHTTKFCLLTVTGDARPCLSSDFFFFARQATELSEEHRHFTLSPSEFAMLNPNSGTCPIFRTDTDAGLTKAIYRRVPILIKEGGNTINPWRVGFRQGLFNMTTDSGLFRSAEELNGNGLKVKGNVFADEERTYLPLFEAKMFHHFDHRYSTYEGATQANLNVGILPATTVEQKQNSKCVIQPLHWVPASEVKNVLNTRWNCDWIISFRLITKATNERTFLPTIMPLAGFGNSVAVVVLESDTVHDGHCLLADLSSFVFDYVVRQKLGGNNMTFGTTQQLPVLPPNTYLQPLTWAGADSRGAAGSSLSAWLLPRVLELTFTAWDLEPFARDCGYAGPPFRWDEDRRFRLRAELDAAFFHLYLPADKDGDWIPARQSDGCPHDESPEDLARLKASFLTPRHAVEYIMETFPIVKRKDIERTLIKDAQGNIIQAGRYITKDTILEIYDAMQTAIRTDQPYQTRLNPPPGPPTDTEGNFIPMAQWDQNNWPSHVHLPRQATVEIPIEIAAVRIERGRVVLDILLLLEAWDKPVSISALEPALVLMRNEAARRSLLSSGTAVVLNVDLLEEPQFVRGLDLIYQGLEANGAIRRVGQSAFELAAGNFVTDAPHTDRERVAETLQAINSLRDIRTLPQVVASLTNERYEVTV